MAFMPVLDIRKACHPMTNTHLTTEEINAWIDGYGSSEELSRFGAHIESCLPCRTEAESLRATKTMFATLRDVDLPRSFALPANMAKPAQTLSSPSSIKSNQGITRFEPAMRLMSIAAVLLFLAVGGINISGVFENNGADSLPAATQPRETDQVSNASQEQEPLQRGEVADEGETAAEGVQLPALATRVESQTQANDNGLTPLDITTVVLGGVALALIAGWTLIHNRAGRSS